MISVIEAHRRFGNLAQIKKGVTIWIEVQTKKGTWKPVFNEIWFLIGYKFHADKEK